MHLRITTMHVVIILRRKLSNTSLGEMIGHTWEEYLFSILFDECVKDGTDAYGPIDIGHILYRYVALHIINESTYKLLQPI